MRYLIFEDQKGGKGYVSIAVYDEIAKHYRENILEDQPCIGDVEETAQFNTKS